METTFNLSRAIQNWRQALTESPAIRPDNLDELETHLRDCITGFEAKGLSAEEAFFIATRRLGRPETLAQEFGKVNAATVWRDRALWMLAGMLFLTVGWDLSSTVSSALTYLGSTMSSNGLALGWWSVAGKFTTLGLVAAVFWRLATGRIGRVSIGTGRISRHPLLFAAATLGGVVLLKLAPSVFEMLSILNLAPHALGQTYVVTQWFNFVGPVIAAVLMVVLFARLWRWRMNLQIGGRVASLALILPLVLALTLSPANAQTNSAPGKSIAPDKQDRATLDQALTLWRAGKKEEATAKFLAVDFTKRPLFPSGSVLNYTEKQFMALPRTAAEKLSKQMLEDISGLKGLCTQVKDTRRSALNQGDKATAEKCTAQLKQCGNALDHPDSLALLKLVGKAVQKMAAEPATPPKN
jgi:hypothetical protein